MAWAYIYSFVCYILPVDSIFKKNVGYNPNSLFFMFGSPFSLSSLGYQLDVLNLNDIKLYPALYVLLILDLYIMFFSLGNIAYADSIPIFGSI